MIFIISCIICNWETGHLCQTSGEFTPEPAASKFVASLAGSHTTSFPAAADCHSTNTHAQFESDAFSNYRYIFLYIFDDNVMVIV